MLNEVMKTIAVLEQYDADTENMKKAVSEAILSLRSVVDMVNQRERALGMTYSL